jgi:mono/diheme cytochrome c family protein
MMKLTARSLLLVLAVSGCGDPPTDDKRGYTKAPLEHPSVVIRGEEPDDMTRYGEPNRVRVEEIELPEQPDSAASAAQAKPVQLPPGVSEEVVTQGKQVYTALGNCFACHGANAEGTPMAPALNDSEWLHIDGSLDAIAGLITNGVPSPKQAPAPMPPKGGSQITEEQVRQVAAYVYSISR